MTYLQCDSRRCDSCGRVGSPVDGEPLVVTAVYECDTTLLADPVAGRDEVVWHCPSCLTDASLDIRQAHDFGEVETAALDRSDQLRLAAHEADRQERDLRRAYGG